MAPADLDAAFKQRLRWAMGALQVCAVRAVRSVSHSAALHIKQLPACCASHMARNRWQCGAMLVEPFMHHAAAAAAAAGACRS